MLSVTFIREVNDSNRRTLIYLLWDNRLHETVDVESCTEFQKQSSNLPTKALFACSASSGWSTPCTEYLQEQCTLDCSSYSHLSDARDPLITPAFAEKRKHTDNTESIDIPPFIWGIPKAVKHVPLPLDTKIAPKPILWNPLQSVGKIASTSTTSQM